jgi:mgtE-like transporter
MKDFTEIMFGQILSITGGLIAGSLLAFFTGQISLIPGLFVLLPGFLGMRGNIAGSLSSRLSSALHLGSLNVKNRDDEMVKENFYASFFLVIFVSLFLGLLAYWSVYFFFGIDSWQIVYVALIAAVITNLILLPLSIRTCFWLYEKGYDPDDIMGPYVSTVGDVVGVLSILIAIGVVA